MKTKFKRWWTGVGPSVLFGTLMLGVLLAGFLLMFTRDLSAEQRCIDMGGQTWDSGMHCVLGDPEVVSSR